MHFRLTGAVLLAAVLLSACSRPAEPPSPPPAAAPPPAPAVTLPAPPPPLGRAELLDAAAAAADAYAAGQPLPAPAAGIAGRSFRLKLPFGCFGPPPAEARLRYAWDEAARTLKLTAAPETWTDQPELKALVGDPQTETLEGFWLRRPWLRGDACPAATGAPTEAAGAPASPETVGLVSVFGREDSRLRKRAGRPYEVTRKLGPEDRPSPNGYRLVLEGRIGGDEAHPPVACRSQGPDERPTCLVRVAIDRVAFESPDGEQFAEWAG